MDNVAIVVDDLDAAVAFFTDLGMGVEARAPIEGVWADRTVGLDGIRSEIVMMRTPDGHGRLELTKYHAPAALAAPESPPNTLGLHRVMFAVDDIDGTLDRSTRTCIGSATSAVRGASSSPWRRRSADEGRQSALA